MTEQEKIDAEQIRALQKQNGELTDKVRELEAYNEKLLDGDIEKHNKIVELEKENEQLRKTETMLKALKDRGVIRSWYYNGSYHVGNELPQ